MTGEGPEISASDPASWDWGRPIFDHVHLRVADVGHSRELYARALAPLGIPLLLDLPHLVQFANLALSDEAEPSAGVHLAFAAADREQVDGFHATGIAAGFTDNGAPGERDYGPPGVGYYAAYLTDPDGNNVEAVHRELG